MSQKSSCGNAVPMRSSPTTPLNVKDSFVQSFFMPNEGTSIPSFGRTTPSATTNVPIFLKHYDRHFLQYYYFLCINYFMKNN